MRAGAREVVAEVAACREDVRVTGRLRSVITVSRVDGGWDSSTSTFRYSTPRSSAVNRSTVAHLNKLEKRGCDILRAARKYMLVYTYPGLSRRRSGSITDMNVGRHEGEGDLALVK